MEKRWLIRVLIVLCMLSLLVMVMTLHRSPTEVSFVPPEFESSALTGIPEVPDGLGYEEMDIGAFRVNLCGRIQVRNGEAEVWFVNPEHNDVWLKLRIMAEDGAVLGETGLIRPGEYVQKVPVADLQSGLPVLLKVMAYEPDTYHSAGAFSFRTHTVE